MSHVDEGQLHAYLDRQLEYAEPGNREELDAHVGECADCAALLERARADRARTEELLSQAEPALGDPPPFEIVAARAHASRRVGTLARTRRLAWAASIAVAVAVGWYARLSLGDDEFDASSIDGVQPSAQTVVEERPAALPSPPGEPVVSVANPVAESPPATTPATALSEDLLATREERRQAVEAERKESEPSLRDMLVAQDTALTRADRARRATDEAAPAFALRSLADSVAVASEAGSRDVPASGIDLWREVDRDAAEEVLGQPVVAVDGLPIAGIAVSAADVAIVRVIQLLPSGDSLEIIQQRADRLGEIQAVQTATRGAGAAGRQEADANRMTTVSRTVDGLLVSGRAAIAPDSLAALLAALREAARPN